MVVDLVAPFSLYFGVDAFMSNVCRDPSDPTQVDAGRFGIFG